MAEIETNDYNLNISRYISTAVAEPEIDLAAVNDDLQAIDAGIRAATDRHNAFLRELGLLPLP
jgi:type I restriction enzyme M protein